MQFRRLVGLMLLAGLAACGKEGQHWYGTLEQDGHNIEYETWYHDPGLERIAGNDGISYRIAVDGKTVQRSGNYIPPEWEVNQGNAMDLSQEFWGKVLKQFEAIKPSKHHKDEHTWIRNGLIDLRDVPRTLPPDHTDQRALTLQAEDPEWAAELKASQEAGRQMMADYRRSHPEEFDEDGNDLPENWGSTRNKNRGFRAQIQEPGWEYHQVLELWAEHFYVTGYDHSGTKAWTYKRRQGSNEPWQIVTDGYRACNHGACPGTEKMKLRETCDSGVVSDWYVVDGECEGNWMTGHLCNDDTSLQINHAQGIWTGWNCPGHNRGIVPKCGRQFK